MKMYDFISSGKKIGREEFEVIEHPNSYEKVGGGIKTRIKKSEVDVLNVAYTSLQMYSLDGNPENFIKKVLEHKKAEVDRLEKMIAKQKNEIISISHEFQDYISNNVVNGEYHTRGELHFNMTDSGLVTGTPVDVADYAVDKIFELHSGLHFGEMLKFGKISNHQIINHTIYVQGKKSNLVIDGLQHAVENPCIISADKFLGIAHKTKVEVNIQTA